MKSIALLGATGSIGLQTLDVIRNHPESFRLHSMAFGRNVQKAVPFIKEFKPAVVVVQDETVKEKLHQAIPYIDILVGSAGMVSISSASEVDVVVNAVLGSIGLEATLEAIRAKKQVAFANKETLVSAGHLVMAEAKKHGVNLLPVDSEHAAIFQCLNGEKLEDVNKLIITASGGSFRDYTRDELKQVTLEDALRHPNWSMGQKITIDSATMMNKGLEVIEAHWLFGIDYNDIEVVQHRESIIHSMVEYKDYSVLAQLGTPDMRVPIQYALTYPERLDLAISKRLNLVEIGKLHFEEMSMDRFPCLRMAYEAGKAGGTATTVLNAANEEAVAQFLAGKIDFLTIEDYVARALDAHDYESFPSLETIMETDRLARSQVRSYIQ
jgi:1-deoxy-D-xylulose-5-phosphate reductoisomerase